ncbi:hypothetical protein ACFX11_032455 [Malus domestica]
MSPTRNESDRVLGRGRDFLVSSFSSVGVWVRKGLIRNKEWGYEVSPWVRKGLIRNKEWGYEAQRVGMINTMQEMCNAPDGKHLNSLACVDLLEVMLVEHLQKLLLIHIAIYDSLVSYVENLL